MIIVGEKSAGGKLSACLRARGFENKKWECHAAKKMLAKILPEQAAITQESPYKEELAVLRESDSLHRASTMVRRSMKVGKEDHWSELWKGSEFNSWTRAKLQECYHEVRQDDDQRKSIVQQIMWKSTNILRRKIVPVQGQGVITSSYVCPHLYRFPIEDYIWWSLDGTREKQCNWWCTACGGQYRWKDPNRVLVVQDSADSTVFRAHAPVHGACDNLVCALKFLGESTDGERQPRRCARRGSAGAEQIEDYG